MRDRGDGRIKYGVIVNRGGLHVYKMNKRDNRQKRVFLFKELSVAKIDKTNDDIGDVNLITSQISSTRFL